MFEMQPFPSSMVDVETLPNGITFKQPRVVMDGGISYLSPSSLLKASHDHKGGCLRKWFLHYVMGLREPQTSYAALGSEIHSAIEHYLKTGESTLPAVVMPGKFYLPEPKDPKIKIEIDVFDLGMEISGVRIKGIIDILNLSSTHKLENHMVTHQAFYPEVNDWKSTSNIARNAKDPNKFLDTIQMPIYGAAALLVRPKAKRVRLSHTYFQTKGATKAEKRTRVFDAADILKANEALIPLVNTLKDVAKERDPFKVPANPAACPAWSGCKFANTQFCSLTPKESRSNLIENISKLKPKKENLQMELLGNLDIGTDDQKAGLAAEMAAMEAEETAKIHPHMKQARLFIADSGKGIPPMIGEAAKQWCIAAGGDISEKIPGIGVLGQVIKAPIEDPEVLIGVARELGTKIGKAFAPEDVAPVESPETPDSDPAQAALPIEGFGAEETKAEEKTPPKKKKTRKKRRTKAQKAADDAFEAATTDAARIAAKAAQDIAYGRTVEAAAPSAPVEGKPTPAKVETPAPIQSELAEFLVDGVWVFVDIAGDSLTDLRPYVDGACAKLCEQYKCLDIRATVGDHPLGFGKWKGILSALIRQNPPKPGMYSLDTRGSDVMEVAADALRQVSAQYFRGVR